MMNTILNAVIRWAVRHCHTITCTTFCAIVEKDRMGYLKRNL